MLLGDQRVVGVAAADERRLPERGPGSDVRHHPLGPGVVDRDEAEAAEIDEEHPRERLARAHDDGAGGHDAGREPVGDLAAGFGGERLQQFVRREERSPGVLRDVGHGLAEDERRAADLDPAAGHEHRPLDLGAVDA